MNILGGLHFIADLVVPDSHVLHDYLAERDPRMLDDARPGREIASPSGD